MLKNKVYIIEYEMISPIALGKDEFIESMSQEHFTLVSDFFETMPKIIHEISVTNPKTKKKNNIVIQGLQSFFE